jgi:putative transcriptional regulator
MMKNLNIAAQMPIPADINADANFGIGRRTGSLVGKLLVASPSLQDSCFTRSVIYLCAHNEGGAMGVVVNYPVKNIEIDDVMEQLNISGTSHRDVPIHFGGPVEGNRGFIIHSDDFIASGTIHQNDGLAITSNAEVLKAIAGGSGPRHSLLALGYSGWGAGQLEAEIEGGSWIVVPATRQILFETGNDIKWNLAIASLGFDVGNFSSVVGHA